MLSTSKMTDDTGFTQCIGLPKGILNNWLYEALGTHGQKTHQLDTAPIDALVHLSTERYMVMDALTAWGWESAFVIQKQVALVQLAEGVEYGLAVGVPVFCPPVSSTFRILVPVRKI